ncbi:hypothetical protein GNIT_3349 [Glaciecola nitratireducens FR1064]|uniref:Uncharacterized protein n=2 Tax=Brumicola TaxID=3160924 RepID=G4QN24_GLANF|nr:hypothetical protein GNIT_3349 [Glaciecola nitratireducens FR1064]
MIASFNSLIQRTWSLVIHVTASKEVADKFNTLMILLDMAMKLLLLTCALLFIGGIVPSYAAVEHQNNESNAVAERLASKDINEVVVIAMQLQLECQELNSQDVCEGVGNILAVLETRLSTLPADHDNSVFFLKGLMEGVNDANQAVIARLKKAP